MISYKDYYLRQIKEVPVIWKLTKDFGQYKAFFKSVLLLFMPMVMYIMWLYDTEQIEIDKRDSEKYISEDKNDNV